jgi:hypothetical protein
MQIAMGVRELLPLYAIARKQGGGPRLLAAYYIFAYSQFEVYIKTVVEDSLAALTASPPPIDRWPDLMLGYLLHKTENLASNYRRYSIDEDETAIMKKVAETARKIVEWGSGSSVITAPSSSDFLDKKKYPSPKNLPQLFRRLGVNAIFAVIGKEGKMNAEMILTSLNDLRTDMAHEGKVPTGFSLADFRMRLDQMGTL